MCRTRLRVREWEARVPDELRGQEALVRKFVAMLLVVLLVFLTGVALAKVNPDVPPVLNVTQAPQAGWLDDDIPVRPEGTARADTVVFGYYTTKADGLKYAVLDGEWNFDHAADDPLEGWTSVDQTVNDQTYWRQVTQAIWNAEGGVIAWPQMTGDGMVLCGATEGHADSLGWANGRGYGNGWCQRLTSPALTYDGTGTVDLGLNYFSESEPGYDYTKIFVESGASRVLINSPGFSGKIGIDAFTWPHPRTGTDRSIESAEAPAEPPSLSFWATGSSWSAWARRAPAAWSRATGRVSSSGWTSRRAAAM
jgi:hypothetical protein